MSDLDGRHLSVQMLEEYIRARARASVPIPGNPETLLSIDIPNETLRLEVSWDGEQPPSIPDYVHISTDLFFREGRNWSALAVHGIRFFAEAYPLLRSVADLVQLKDASFTSAVKRSLASYHDLLASTGQMPPTEEIGLVGELLVLAHLIKKVGPGPAMAAWRGGERFEEHDFGLAKEDVEVKTTTSETRRHWIGSISQLRTSPGRPLWLLSIQLTGAGASNADRLPDIVDRVLSQLPDELRADFQTRISGTTFRPSQPRESFRLLRLRSTPLCFAVDDQFPRIDHQVLIAGGARVECIPEVNYLINLEGIRPSTSAPVALANFGEEKPQ